MDRIEASTHLVTLAHMILGAARDQEAQRCSTLLSRYRAALVDCSRDHGALEADPERVRALHQQMMTEAGRVEDQARQRIPTAAARAEHLLAMTELHGRPLATWRPFDGRTCTRDAPDTVLRESAETVAHIPSPQATPLPEEISEPSS